MMGPLTFANRSEIFRTIFDPLLFVEFELGNTVLIAQKSFSNRARRVIGQSAESILGQLEPVLIEWIRSDLSVAAIPAAVLDPMGFKKQSMCLFNLQRTEENTTRCVLILLAGNVLPSLETLIAFRDRILRESAAVNSKPEARSAQPFTLSESEKTAEKNEKSGAIVGQNKRLQLSRRALLAEAELESQRLAMLQIAHDIRIPISALRLIRTNLSAEWETMRSKFDSPQIHMEGLLGRLGKQLTNLELFASSYLDLELATLSRGEDRVTQEIIELNVLWLELLDAHAEDLKSKRLQLKLEGSWETNQVTGRRDGVIRILENILSNAIKFSRPGGTLWTSLGSDAHGTILSLEDSGPGMPMDADSVQFDLAKKNLGLAGSGYGLGLAAAKRLAERMSGSLISAPPLRGKGARLLLMLPSGSKYPPGKP